MNFDGKNKFSQLKTSTYRICFVFLFLGVLFLPFANTKIGTNLPSYLRVLLNNENSISMYFFLLFVSLLFINEVKQNRFNEYKPILYFFIIYIIINLISHIHGVVVSPYLKGADYSLLSGIYLFIFDTIKNLFPQMSNFHNFAILSTIKQFVSTCTFFSTTYFMVFSFYIFYKNTRIDYMHYIWLAISFSTTLILLYEIIEFAYFLDCSWAAPLISRIFNIIYDVASGHGWWPSELPQNIRSIFPEQSFFAYWGACACCFLLYGIFYEKKILSSIQFVLLSTAVFASNSRTGTLLIFGGFGVFITLSIFQEKNKNTLMQVTIVIVFLLIAFLLALFFLNISTKVETFTEESTTMTISDYVDTNVNSLVNLNERSNNARYGMIVAQFNIFKKNLLFGTGKDLVGAYIIDNFPQYTYANAEKENWILHQEKNGPFNSDGLPSLNEYFYSLAYSGILGFIVNSLPFIVLSIAILWAFIKTRQNFELKTILTLCAIIIAYGISNIWMINYIFIIVFSIGFTSLMQYKIKDENVNS